MGFLPWPPALLLLLLLLLSAASQTPDQHSCLNTSGVNYTSNSIFDSNLNSVLSTMSHNVGDNGFYNASAGQSPDRANAVALCRGDVQLDVCRSCVKEAAAELVRLCPNQKQGVIYYEFCLLRFSNISIFGSFVRSPVFFMVSAQNATEPYLFFRDLGILLDALSNRAAGGSSRRKVAFGNRRIYNSQTLYALVQCSPDLRRDDCLICLSEIDRNQGSRHGSRIGCRALLPSCNIRFETQPFYNETRLQELSESTPEILTPPITGQGKESRTIIVVVVVIATCLAIAACVGILIARRMKKKQVEAIENDIRLVDSLQFEFDEIKAATNDFSDANKLGKGGFGAVYRGKLVSGQEIAVKRLSADSGQGHIEFKNEVSLVAKLQHRNLVKLMGFSIERKERLLVYELVTNASLDKFLFDPTKSSELGWEKRNKIIFGIARGLHYLHEESRLRIIHRDLKASNVLLDNDMNPKIADFGLAWLCVADELQGDTNRVAGTYGYMAPEYVMHGQFSVKSDVFSFGVLVLEIISGQKNNSFRGDEYVEGLLSLAWKLWRRGKAEELIDPLLRVDASNHIYALRCIHIGLLCVQENPCDRPNMAAVVLMLGSDSISLSTPREPAFFMPGEGGDDSNNALVRVYGFKEVKSNESYCGKKLGGSVEASENKLTVTDLYPR